MHAGSLWAVIWRALFQRSDGNRIETTKAARVLFLWIYKKTILDCSTADSALRAPDDIVKALPVILTSSRYHEACVQIVHEVHAIVAGTGDKAKENAVFATKLEDEFQLVKNKGFDFHITNLNSLTNVLTSSEKEFITDNYFEVPPLWEYIAISRIDIEDSAIGCHAASVLTDLVSAIDPNKWWKHIVFIPWTAKRVLVAARTPEEMIALSFFLSSISPNPVFPMFVSTVDTASRLIESLFRNIDVGSISRLRAVSILTIISKVFGFLGDRFTIKVSNDVVKGVRAAISVRSRKTSIDMLTALAAYGLGCSGLSTENVTLNVSQLHAAYAALQKDLSPTAKLLSDAPGVLSGQLNTVIKELLRRNKTNLATFLSPLRFSDKQNTTVGSRIVFALQEYIPCAVTTPEYTITVPASVYNWVTTSAMAVATPPTLPYAGVQSTKKGAFTPQSPSPQDVTMGLQRLTVTANDMTMSSSISRPPPPPPPPPSPPPLPLSATPNVASPHHQPSATLRPPTMIVRPSEVSTIVASGTTGTLLVPPNAYRHPDPALTRCATEGLNDPLVKEWEARIAAAGIDMTQYQWPDFAFTVYGYSRSVLVVDSVIHMIYPIPCWHPNLLNIYNTVGPGRSPIINGQNKRYMSMSVPVGYTFTIQTVRQRVEDPKQSSSYMNIDPKCYVPYTEEYNEEPVFHDIVFIDNAGIWCDRGNPLHLASHLNTMIQASTSTRRPELGTVTSYVNAAGQSISGMDIAMDLPPYRALISSARAKSSGAGDSGAGVSAVPVQLQSEGPTTHVYQNRKPTHAAPSSITSLHAPTKRAGRPKGSGKKASRNAIAIVSQKDGRIVAGGGGVISAKASSLPMLHAADHVIATNNVSRNVLALQGLAPGIGTRDFRYPVGHLDEMLASAPRRQFMDPICEESDPSIAMTQQLLESLQPPQPPPTQPQSPQLLSSGMESGQGPALLDTAQIYNADCNTIYDVYSSGPSLQSNMLL